jgi:hypothetical protein
MRLNLLHKRRSASTRSNISWWPMRLPVAVVAAVAINNRIEEDSKEVGVVLVVAMEVVAAIPTTPTVIISAKSTAS